MLFLLLYKSIAYQCINRNLNLILVNLSTECEYQKEIQWSVYVIITLTVLNLIYSEVADEKTVPKGNSHFN